MINRQHFDKWFDSQFEINENNKIKFLGKSRYLTVNDLFHKYKEFCSISFIDDNFTFDDINNIITGKYKVIEDDEPKFTCRDAIVGILSKRDKFNISSSFSEITRYSKDKSVQISSDIDDVYNHLIEVMTQDSDYKCYTLGTIKSTLNNMAAEARSNCLGNVFKQIKYDPNYVDYTNQYLKAIYDYLKPSESYEIFSTLFKHWAWQVKRKICNKEVVWHIWINLFGATGLGKSYMIKKMCGVLDEFMTTTTISKLFDDTKEIKRLTEKYILNLDELAINREDSSYEGALSSDEQATLKSMLTGDYLDTRVYGTQNQARRKITFSCISSSNNHLYDVIYDETSMRRFFDFNCTAQKKDNYDDINKWLDNSIDFWKGIDETLEKGYWQPISKVGLEIDKIQKGYYPTKSTLMYWLEYNKLEPGDSSPDLIFPKYKEWCKLSGYTAKTLRGFIDELKKRFPEFTSSDGIIRVKLTSINAPKNPDNLKLGDFTDDKSNTDFFESLSHRVVGNEDFT